MNTWDSLRWRFLAAVILVRQLSSNRISERHSSEVISIQYMSTQDRTSEDRVVRRSINISAFNVQP